MTETMIGPTVHRWAATRSSLNLAGDDLIEASR